MILLFIFARDIANILVIIKIFDKIINISFGRSIFSPSGCTFWGKKPWSRKKKILWQLGILVGAPVGIALIAGIAVPAIIIGQYTVVFLPENSAGNGRLRPRHGFLTRKKAKKNCENLWRGSASEDRYSRT